MNLSIFNLGDSNAIGFAVLTLFFHRNTFCRAELVFGNLLLPRFQFGYRLV